MPATTPASRVGLPLGCAPAAPRFPSLVDDLHVVADARVLVHNHVAQLRQRRKHACACVCVCAISPPAGPRSDAACTRRPVHRRLGNCKQNDISLQRTVEPAPMPMGTPPALMSASRCEWGGRGGSR